MQTISIDKVSAGCGNISKGDRIALTDKAGKTKIGTVSILKIFRVKKGCKKYLHRSYAYAQYREGKKVKSKYIGVVR